MVMMVAAMLSTSMAWDHYPDRYRDNKVVGELELMVMMMMLMVMLMMMMMVMGVLLWHGMDHFPDRYLTEITRLGESWS